MKTRQQRQEEAQTEQQLEMKPMAEETFDQYDAAHSPLHYAQSPPHPAAKKLAPRPLEFFIGPMSKNVVDAVMEFCDEGGHSIGLIASRRQVEWNGGYVNNWTTKEFAEYTKKIFSVRDHAGPGQGQFTDDGYTSQ